MPVGGQKPIPEEPNNGLRPELIFPQDGEKSPKQKRKIRPQIFLTHRDSEAIEKN